MWEFVGTSGVQCAQGCLLSPAPTHYRPGALGGMRSETARSPAAEPSQLAFRFSLPSSLPFWPSQRAPPTLPSVRPSVPPDKPLLSSCFLVSQAVRKGRGGPAGCVVRKSQGANGSLHAPLPPLCAPRSVHECAPVKIDLLKGQQPLNLLPQEAFSTPQGDWTPYTLHRMAQRQRGCARSGGTFLRERRSVPDGRTDGRTARRPACSFFGCPPSFSFEDTLLAAGLKAVRQQLECHFFTNLQSYTRVLQQGKKKIIILKDRVTNPTPKKKSLTPGASFYGGRPEFPAREKHMTDTFREPRSGGADSATSMSLR